MIMLADKTGEVEKVFQSVENIETPGVSQLWSVGHEVPPRLQRSLCH